MLALSLTRFLPPMPFWSAGRLGFPSGVVAVAMTDRTFGESREVVCRAVSGLPVNAGDSFRAFDLLRLHGRRDIVGVGVASARAKL